MQEPADEEDVRIVVTNRVRHCILSILHQLESGGVENGHHRLEWLLSLVTRYHESNFIERGVVNLISEALGCLTYSCKIINRTRTEGIFTGSPGRPKFNFPYEQLNFLLDRRFTVIQISALLGVSSRTVERRLQVFGFSVRATYSEISE
jgi:AraC-like DNA-binding protein